MTFCHQKGGRTSHAVAFAVLLSPGIYARQHLFDEDISDDIAVMYLGKCVEKAPSAELFANPLHPYTKALLSAIPVPKLSKRHSRPTVIKGEVSNPINPKPGCRFAPRCEYACEKCMGQDIPLREVAPNHFVSCVLMDK